jgi:PAS domain S-box-containing protein
MGPTILDSRNIGNENTYRNIYDSITDGLIICDLETGRIVDANSAASKMHGFPQDEFIGQPVLLIVHPEYQEIFNKNFQMDYLIFRQSIYAGMVPFCMQNGMEQQ